MFVWCDFVLFLIITKFDNNIFLSGNAIDTYFCDERHACSELSSSQTWDIDATVLTWCTLDVE